MTVGPERMGVRSGLFYRHYACIFKTENIYLPMYMNPLNLYCVMKKLFLFLLFAISLATCPALYAQKNLTAGQQAMQNGIRQFLRTEGYVPTIDESDNSLMFKKEGHTYWVYVNENGPYYVTTQRAGYSTEPDERNECIRIANEVNSTKKAAKVYVADNGSVVFVEEQFVSSVAEYKKVFSRIMEVIDSAVEQFDEEY